MIKFSRLTLFALTAVSSCIVVSASLKKTIEWGTLTERLPYPVSDMTATLIPGRTNTDDDIILIAGGCSSKKGNEKMGDGYYCADVTDKMYSFNVRTKIFKEMKNMPQARYRHAAVAIYGKLYIVGGRDVDDKLIGQIYVYDPFTDDWSKVRMLPENYWVSDNAALTYEGNLYVVGGFGEDYVAQTFMIQIDLKTNGITAKKPMPTSRGDANAVSYRFADGKTIAYIMGGFTHENQFCAPLADAEMYDFITDEWTEIDDLNFKRGDKAVVVHNGRVVAIGGESKHETKCEKTGSSLNEEGSGSILVDTVEYFDPRDSEPMWKFETKLEEHRFRAAAVSVKSTGSVYVFGGQSLYDDGCDCYPTSDTIFEYIEEVEDVSSSTKISTFGVCMIYFMPVMYFLVQ